MFFFYVGNIEKCPFTYSYWLNGRWFLQIVDTVWPRFSAVRLTADRIYRGYGVAPEFYDIINEKPLKIHRKSTENPLKSESLNT